MPTEESDIKVEVIEDEKKERRIELDESEKENYIKANTTLVNIDNIIVQIVEREQKIKEDLIEALSEKKKVLAEQTTFFQSILDKYYIKIENIKEFNIRDGYIVENIVEETEDKKVKLSPEQEETIKEEMSNANGEVINEEASNDK